MPHVRLSRRIGSSFFILFCFALAGCAGPSTEVGNRIDSRLPELEAKHLLVLESDDSPAFTGVTRAIAKKLNADLTVLSLKGDAAADLDVLQQLQRHNGRIIVAVGLDAALAARKLGRGKVVFCQVFNYEDFDLLTPWMKGVSATPPIKQQFAVWKKLDPNLKRVGVITGPRLQHLVTEAHKEASANGIELKHVQVRSDLETLYALRRLGSNIQGLWLLPDNRILSKNSIRDILSYSRKQAKQVAVFSRQLLSVGGVMSFDSVHNDIADQVIARSKQALQSDTPEIPGPPILSLTQLDIKINPLAVKQLGLQFPAALKSSSYVP